MLEKNRFVKKALLKHLIFTGFDKVIYTKTNDTITIESYSKHSDYKIVLERIGVDNFREIYGRRSYSDMDYESVFNSTVTKMVITVECDEEQSDW